MAMESGISSIRKQYCNIRENYRMNYSYHLRNLGNFELLELKGESSGQLGSNAYGKQVLTTYRNLFNGEYSTMKPIIGRTILVRGEAGVGKTMLCMSIVEDWAMGKLFQEFQVVLFLPLRDVASVCSLLELLNVLFPDLNADACTKVATYLEKNEEHSVLIIADGWEDLQCHTDSFFHSLLFSNDIMPTSSITVLITSRSDCIQTHTLKLIDRFITLTGFDRMAIESVIQSEFEGDITKIRYLTAQLNDNPLLVSTCSTPLNLAVLCDLCRSDHTRPLPNTMTGLYAKLVWALAVSNIKANDTYKNMSLSTYDDLPEELLRPWELICELAFRKLKFYVEKGHDTFSQSDALKLSPPELKMISYFGLIKPILSESGDANLSFSFLNPYFEKYLASLHLAKQPYEAQLTLIQELSVSTECDSEAVITFWHFFISNYVCVVINVNPDIIMQVLKIISTGNHSIQGSCFVNLCHLSFEAKNPIVNHQVVEAMKAIDRTILKFGYPRNIHDCIAMTYVIQNIVQDCELEINFQDCCLNPEHINSLAKALGDNSSIVQVKGLNLSGNKLINSLAVDFFNRAAAAFKSLRILILRNCEIGTSFDIQAILAALIESSCQTLTHLDLSFNPISISFLLILQHHFQSYTTFDGLQNLSLKGSFKTDITTSFLSNFSDTLTSRCKFLRQLDLSDNNLGEPGNPDLSKVISQLLSLGSDFHLCLNEEYMSEVDDEFIYVMEETIKRKGTINHTMAHGVFVGPGRSGKNTLMSRLVGNGPPEPNSRSSSTGVLEDIVKVEVKKIYTVATAVSNLEWKTLKYDEEALELIMTTARHHSATARVSKPITFKYILEEHEEDLIPDIKSVSQKSLARPKQRRKFKLFNTKFFKKLKTFKKKKVSDGKVVETEKNVVVYKPDLEPVDIFKRAMKLRGMDALREHLESSWSLYLTNTGGQLEFQEHLPLLVCGPSIFIVTFPLHYDLEKPYDVRYEYPDGRVEAYKSSVTLLEELLQTLATINVSNFTSGQQRNAEADIKPKIFFVGTHKDCLSTKIVDESIQKTDKLLQSFVRQTSLFRQGSIQFAQAPERLIFAVNNLSNDDDEFQKIRSAVQQTVERNEFTIECPSSWLILSLILRAKHKSDRVLSLEKCYNIAKECGITDHQELKQALSFIHSRLGLIRYFNTNDLNTLVVIDPQILFDRITDLIVKTFTSEYVEVNEIEDFRRRGIIPLAVMQKFSGKSHSDSQLEFTWLTKLLNYLRIAALFTDRDGDKYFFPSALCHAPELHHSDQSSSNLQPHLLVGFESGFCPRGIPGALIKYLMTNEMKSKTSWDIIPDKIFRNQVSFAIQAHEIITLKILPTHLEISCESEEESDVDSKGDSLINELIKKTCEIAYVQIRKGMRTVTSQCNECNFFFGFYCTLTSTCKAQHPAQLQWNDKYPFKLVCKVTNKRGNLPKGYEIWNLQRKPNLGKAQLDEEIDACNNGVPKHLGQIADHMTEWEGRISEELQLTPADVARILKKHPNRLELQLRDALLTWKQRLGSDATYQKLIDIFESIDCRSYAEFVRNIVYSVETTTEGFSDYDEPNLLQPNTYPHSEPSPLLPPKPSTRTLSSCDEFLVINQAAAQDLPEGADVYNQKVLKSFNVSTVPLFSSKQQGVKRVDSAAVALSSRSESTENYRIYVGKYDFYSQGDDLLNFKEGDLMYIINADEDDRWFVRLKDSGKEGYIPSNYMDEYISEKCFFGSISREKAERWLMMPYNRHGSYLVRDSVTNPGRYSLSVREGEKVTHYIIHQSDDGSNFCFISRHAYFKTIVELVAYYKNHPRGIKLIHPCIVMGECQAAHLYDWEIDRSQIKLVVKLTEGKFSEVWEGLLKGTIPVAVKVRKPQTMILPDFLQMASLMKTLRHKRLVHLYGVCTKEEPIYIITEHMKHGSLFEYLHNEGRPLLTLAELINTSSQVAEGMAYLEEHHCIHRDLAAKNILVEKKLITCKIANFEMAQVINEDIIQNTIHNKTWLAYRWTAPEVITQNRLSTKSDVWSFGIVLYEIITCGKSPYPGMTDTMVLERLQQGYRMPQPHKCPKKLYNIMLDCWQREPENRPTFKTLWQELKIFFVDDPRRPIFRKNDPQHAIFADPAEVLAASGGVILY